MRRLALSLILPIAFAGAGAVLAQSTVQEAKEDGKNFATDMRANDALVPSETMRDQVPGYQGTDLPQSGYFDDPDKLVADAGAQASSNEAFVVSTDRNKTRPQFDAQEILDTTRRATEIEANPDTYLQGEQMGGQAGSCTPLPPGGGNVSYYEATCNYGSKLDEVPRTCTSTLNVSVENRTLYYYHMSTIGPYVDPDSMADEIAAGTCKAVGTASYCGTMAEYGSTAAGSCNRDFGNQLLQVMECSVQASVKGNTIFSGTYPVISRTTGQHWFRVDNAAPVVSTNKVNGCTALENNAQCVAQSAEVCTDSDPQTRIINGVPVTQPCWAWQTNYTCNEITQGNDCGELDDKPECSYVRDECIDDEDDPDYTPGACKVSQKVYRCPVPTTPDNDPKQYVCGNDVYCINGDCETIEREASTEFKDALVALHALGQAGEEFDEENFTVFSGTRETCHKPVFGLVNCCAGKTSGLLTAGAGAAAIAGGPTAIAALATPFLTMFLCSTEEKMLDIKDRMGFCHKVGTYCSSSVLGICKTKRTAYCCFESKLSRILQEQGRPQLNKPWGKPKKEQCQGFTIDEFSRLDLSVMDFTEVYSEFVDAAKLPDEVSTLSEIQDKIQDYYDIHTSQ
ncbi:type-F conjugative transfer system mating-pair stabilization protein TraN (plasmid) [Sphingobium yanoikuyae]|uniref:Type-F conjugative transfer system mating-pair stabilization protein TraN n=1 Tax=Sphingobium yanoikuyae TaxID=13690 RepID=A0A6P1GQ69_SPHYA|nr:conjugal transfer protein TraN [Sphingobium yanoikuyae]QHD70669.1 type-F conjugative transfer system mating-pair stabilization protein TraN [Sphingobium yanoikuyae]